MLKFKIGDQVRMSQIYFDKFPQDIQREKEVTYTVFVVPSGTNWGFGQCYWISQNNNGLEGLVYEDEIELIEVKDEAENVDMSTTYQYVLEICRHQFQMYANYHLDKAEQNQCSTSLQKALANVGMVALIDKALEANS